MLYRHRLRPMVIAMLACLIAISSSFSCKRKSATAPKRQTASSEARSEAKQVLLSFLDSGQSLVVWNGQAAVIRYPTEGYFFVITRVRNFGEGNYEVWRSPDGDFSKHRSLMKRGSLGEGGVGIPINELQGFAVTYHSRGSVNVTLYPDTENPGAIALSEGDNPAKLDLVKLSKLQFRENRAFDEELLERAVLKMMQEEGLLPKHLQVTKQKRNGSQTTKPCTRQGKLPDRHQTAIPLGEPSVEN